MTTKELAAHLLQLEDVPVVCSAQEGDGTSILITYVCYETNAVVRAGIGTGVINKVVILY